uniref:Reverse transcriptase domain-containing protein n=1 Tax=Megaselia scalaris TaxID=36166 RepID=T1H0A2_MEGSC
MSNRTIKRAFKRGTSQGGEISPLLWLFVVNELFKAFENNGVTIVVYADDVALLARGQLA